MNFSIIIPTYNRDQDLEECLESIKMNSAYKNEVIVLYNMNEKTKAICDKYGAKSVFDNARKDGKRVKGLWSILNEGLKAAENDFVMYLNDDCLVLPEWDKIAEQYFTKNPNLGLLVLKTKGIGQIQEFRVGYLGPDYPGIPCANYAILNKKSNHFFDDNIQWNYGDADIALQFAADEKFVIECTEENMIIHNHKIDNNRIEHDSDMIANWLDERYFNLKWCEYLFTTDGAKKYSSFIHFIKRVRCQITFDIRYIKIHIRIFKHNVKLFFQRIF